MTKDSSGDWVTYDDYLALETERNELLERVSDLTNLADEYRMEKERLEDELAKIISSDV
jgi:hypothetical protein